MKGVPSPQEELRDAISSALSYTAAGADCFALTDAILPLFAARVAAERTQAAAQALTKVAVDLRYIFGSQATVGQYEVLDALDAFATSYREIPSEHVHDNYCRDVMCPAPLTQQEQDGLDYP